MSHYYQMFASKIDAYTHDSSSQLTPYFEKAERLTGVKRGYIAQTVFGLLGLYLIVGHAAQFVCNLIGFVYPAYKSLGALESSDKRDDTKWLTYWVVFAAFSVVDFFSNCLLSWFPLYWLAKVVFLLWCSADIPANGANLIYGRFLRPLFLQQQQQRAAAPKSAGSAKED